MATVESRCQKCTVTRFQCWDCQKRDKAASKTQRRQKQRSPAQEQFDSDLAKAIAESTKPEPKQVVVNSEGQQRQSALRTALLDIFIINSTPRDGHCLFHSIARGLRELGIVKKKPTAAFLREQVANFLIENDGIVPGAAQQLSNFFERREDGSIVYASPFQAARGHDYKDRITLAQYARKVSSGSLFGGELEICVLAHIHNVVINIYSWIYYDGKSLPVPERYGPENAKDTISVFYEQNFESEKGDRDHFEFMTDKFSKWREYMKAMPKWNVDICLCHGLAGRGIKALRDFKKGEVVMWYDGHRVNSHGVVKIERKSITELFAAMNCRKISKSRTQSALEGSISLTSISTDIH